MRINNSNSSSSWNDLKKEGRDAFNSGKYEEALEKYRSSLSLTPPENERQVLLSNVVACRLKLGSRAQYEAALVDAKQCVSLNERWSKAHVRLASVYIALQRSNDACNSLQRALTIDPSNQLARTMLTNELRRGRYQRPSSNSNTSTAAHEESQASYGLDATDELSFLDRVRFMVQSHVDKLRTWYASLGDDMKSLLQVAFILMVLYVMLGGRFGFNGNNVSKGNYRSGNAYDRYYGRYHSTGSNTNHMNQHHRRTSYDDTSYNNDDYTSNSYHFPDLFDGSVLSYMSIFAILYVAHKYGGINPFQAFWMLNVLAPGGRRHRYHRLGRFGRFGRGFYR